MLSRRPRFIPPLGPPKRTPQQKVLAQWRRADSSHVEAIRGHRPHTPGDLMPKVLQTLRMDRRRTETEIIKVWNHTLDPVLAAHAQPTGLARGTLFVTVDSSVWLYEIIRYRRKDILERLQHSFGKTEIARISFRVG